MELIPDNSVLADDLVDSIFPGKFIDDLLYLFQTRCSLRLEKSPLPGFVVKVLEGQMWSLCFKFLP